MPMPDRKTAPSGLQAALRIAASENYLGDQAVVDALLRPFALSAVKRRQFMETNAASIEDLAACLKLAGIFLGENKSFAVIPGWNEPGGIDVFVFKQLNRIGDTPREVVAGAFVQLLIEIYGVLNQAQSRALEENWQCRIDAIVHTYTGLLVGLSPKSEPLDWPHR